MVASLKDEILRMAAGNLRDSVPEMGQDEIGIIAEELDNLRTALQDTLVREKESRRANQDLITAMSHDLRTPLTILNGYFSDSSRMFCIGEVDDVSKKLVEDTLKAVQLGLSEVRPFNRLGNVGAVINEFAQSQGYKVVRDIGGHGVGLEFHEDPFVSYVTRRDTGMLLVPGMVFTIEPMINLGTDEIFIDSDNDWTVYTEDGAPSAQWEVTVAVTEDGYEILAY